MDNLQFLGALAGYLESINEHLIIDTTPGKEGGFDITVNRTTYYGETLEKCIQAIRNGFGDHFLKLSVTRNTFINREELKKMKDELNRLKAFEPGSSKLGTGGGNSTGKSAMSMEEEDS